MDKKNYLLMDTENYLIQKKIDELYNQLENKEEDTIILFHSGTKDIDKYLSECIEPKFGDWLQEVLDGSIDDDALYQQIKNSEPVSFFDTKPSWVSMKVARKINKPLSEVSWSDIEQYGQLSICIIKEDDKDFFLQAGERSDDFAEKSYYLGDKLKKTIDYELPFGVEKGDIYSYNSITPNYTLTGKKLVDLLARYYPEENIVSDKKIHKMKKKLNFK